MFLAIAVVIFIAIHLTAALPNAKAALQNRLGPSYGPVFGIHSLLALALVVLAWMNRDFVPIYEPPTWGKHVTFSFVLLAFLCLGQWIFRGKLRQKLRFPFALAAIFLGLGHLFVRGDAASITLFAGLATYGIAHYIIASLNGIRPSPEVRQGHDLLAILGGIALYAVMAQLHGAIIGVPVITLMR